MHVRVRVAQRIDRPQELASAGLCVAMWVCGLFRAGPRELSRFRTSTLQLQRNGNVFQLLILHLLMALQKSTHVDNTKSVIVFLTIVD